MKNILCIRLPNWPITRLLRKRPPSTATTASAPDASTNAERLPLLIVQTRANRQLIVGCCDLAAHHGIHPGMTLAQARPLYAHLQSVPFRPDLDQKALEALARYLDRFTPAVALATNDAVDLPESASTSALTQAQLYLDLTGCEHLFGGLSTMVQTIARAFHRLRIPAILAVAPTPGAAYALSFKPDPQPKHANTTGIRTLIARSPDIFAATLPHLPLRALRLPDDLLQSLHRLGIENIHQLQQLSRDQLPARFGKLILKRLDQLTGQLAEPLTCQRWSPPLQATFDFDGSVADPQALEQVFQNLLAPLLLQLERQGEGLRELQITLTTEATTSPLTQPPTRNTQSQSPSSLRRSVAPSLPPSPSCLPASVPSCLLLSPSSPTRDPRALLNLYRCAFDQFTQASNKPTTSKRAPRYSRNYDAGFTAMTLTVLRSQPLPHRQADIHQPARATHLHTWPNTLDLLRTRLGEQSIEQVELHESYLPEKSFRRLPATLPDVSTPANPPTIELGNRPLHLLSTPAKLRVMVSPSHDADGAPLSFNLDGAVHRVLHSIGPERIAGQWWEGHHKTRDYFDIADDSGQRYWLFRVQETSQWYLHGIFE